MGGPFVSRHSILRYPQPEAGPVKSPLQFRQSRDRFWPHIVFNRGNHVSGSVIPADKNVSPERALQGIVKVLRPVALRTGVQRYDASDSVHLQKLIR